MTDVSQMPAMHMPQKSQLGFQMVVAARLMAMYRSKAMATRMRLLNIIVPVLTKGTKLHINRPKTLIADTLNNFDALLHANLTYPQFQIFGIEVRHVGCGEAHGVEEIAAGQSNEANAKEGPQFASTIHIQGAHVAN